MVVLYVILGILGGLIFLIVVFGFLSPRYSHLERTIEINATPDKVYEQMIDLKNFVNNWSPWTALDPDMQQTFSGNERSIGRKYEWKGDRKKVGAGSMTITFFENNQKVVMRLRFEGRGESDVTFYVRDAGNGKVIVTWDFHADNKNNPVARIFGRYMDKFLGPDYEKGLKNLKAFCEK